MLRAVSLRSVLVLAACAATTTSVGVTAGCGVRAPARIDLEALVRQRGPVEARRDLLMRIINEPKDLSARLALARFDERDRPAEAIDQLAAVEALDGPVGVRWRDDDRARFGKLLAARGQLRARRGAASAVDDLDHATRLGVEVAEDDRVRARVGVAIAQLRHVDPPLRARGAQTLAALTGTKWAVTGWRGARADATPFDRGTFGVWLWSVGARRAAWDALSAWHAASPMPRDAALQGAYLTAFRWWTPVDLPPPPDGDLVGLERCMYVACEGKDIAAAPAYALARAGAATSSSTGRTTDPMVAAAWVQATLVAALHGELAWGPAITARVDVAAAFPSSPAHVRPVLGRLVGRKEPVPGLAPTASDAERLVIAAEHALAGDGPDSVRASLGALADSVDGRLLVSIAAPAATGATTGATTGQEPAKPEPSPVARYAVARISEADVVALDAIVVAYHRDPAVADRLGRELVASSLDAAVGHASLGAVFDALADPARARGAWQAAVDASPEPRFVLGLAAAQARGGDGDAALVTATMAAAASGDPAASWSVVAAALLSIRPIKALDAARTAIELAGPDALPRALEIAIEASVALGRDEQVASLRARLAKVVPSSDPARGTGTGGAEAINKVNDDTDPAVALLALHASDRDAETRAAAISRAWTATRWNPRDVTLRIALRDALAPGEPQRVQLEAELAALAADPDADRGLAAVVALRP